MGSMVEAEVAKAPSRSQAPGLYLKLVAKFNTRCNANVRVHLTTAIVTPVGAGWLDSTPSRWLVYWECGCAARI